MYPDGKSTRSRGLSTVHSALKQLFRLVGLKLFRPNQTVTGLWDVRIGDDCGFGKNGHGRLSCLQGSLPVQSTVG